MSIYAFVISAGETYFGLLNFSITGCLLLILIFAGSSRMAESISCGKYRQYGHYLKTVNKYIPLRPYTGDEI